MLMLQGVGASGFQTFLEKVRISFMIWLVSVSTKSLVPLTCITQDFALGMIMTLSTKSLVLLTCITQDFALGMIMTRKGIAPKTASAGSKGDSAQNR